VIFGLPIVTWAVLNYRADKRVICQLARLEGFQPEMNIRALPRATASGEGEPRR
jgi:hypothetical protein